MIDIDLEGDSVENATPSETGKLRIARLVDEWDEARKRLVAAAEVLKAEQARITRLEQEEIPAAMTEAGLKEFKTTTGRVVKVEVVARGNIPADSTVEKAKGFERRVLEQRRIGALTYVREHWPGLLKTEVSVALGKGEAGVAARIAELIRDQFKLTAEVAETIHPATLNSHFKELNEEGKIKEVPADLFALYIGPIAKVK